MPRPIHPPGSHQVPAQFTDHQVDQCIAVYAPDYAPGELTREKATEILHNVTRVYGLLAEWARRADARKLGCGDAVEGGCRE